MARVKNINGTSQNTCGCGNWLTHWEKFSRQSANYCSKSTCFNNQLVGAHVQKADSFDMKWYIVPLCQSHNMSAGILDIGNTTLVSANKSETCEKN